MRTDLQKYPEKTAFGQSENLHKFHVSSLKGDKSIACDDCQIEASPSNTGAIYVRLVTGAIYVRIAISHYAELSLVS